MGGREDGVCCEQEWRMAMEEGLVGLIRCSFEQVGRILCPSVMVDCNWRSDGRSGAARSRRWRQKEDAAARRLEKRWLWLWSKSGAEDGHQVD